MAERQRMLGHHWASLLSVPQHWHRLTLVGCFLDSFICCNSLPLLPLVLWWQWVSGPLDRMRREGQGWPIFKRTWLLQMIMLMSIVQDSLYRRDYNDGQNLSQKILNFAGFVMSFNEIALYHCTDKWEVVWCTFCSGGTKSHLFVRGSHCSLSSVNLKTKVKVITRTE